MASQDYEEIVALLKESIAASNRTNHAVRSIAVPSTIMLVTFLVTFPFAAFALFEGSGGGLVLASLILIVGGVIAIGVQIQETGASKIPDQESAGALNAAVAEQTPDELVPETTAVAYDSNEPCTCKKWERTFSGSGTQMIDGVERCGICRRPVQ